ncbi:MAG: DEAD-box type RNA helicase, partial [Bogoriella megaspora]
MEERDIVGSIQKLQQLPAGLHLLCPRDSDDDQRLFYDEDTGSKTGAEPQGDADAARRKCVSDAKARIQLLVTGMVIFAFDGPTAKDLQDWLKVRLEKQLKICDICVREYYRAKKELTIKLNEEYEEEQVSVFCNFFDEVDIKRIRHGLEQARQNLLDTAPGDRGLSAVSREGMYAIFEALNCE